MKRCEQQCPSRLAPVLPPSPLAPGSSSCNQPRARRIGPRPNDRTANIWQLRNMSLHLIIAVNTGRTRRVATGGESDEIRSRPRAPAWGKFRFAPLSPCCLSSPPPSLSHRTIYIIIVDDAAAPYRPPIDARTLRFSRGRVHFCRVRWQIRFFVLRWFHTYKIVYGCYRKHRRMRPFAREDYKIYVIVYTRAIKD